MKEVVDYGKVEALKSVRPRTEPPYAERHVRWCERGRQTPPTRLRTITDCENNKGCLIETTFCMVRPTRLELV